MMAQVDPSLQAVKFRHEVAHYSSILGDNVDSKPPVGSHRIISFPDKALTMFPVSVAYIREMFSEHMFRSILMMLKGVIQSLRDIGLKAS